jgi:hypothetical protein
VKFSRHPPVTSLGTRFKAGRLCGTVQISDSIGDIKKMFLAGEWHHIGSKVQRKGA